MIVGLLLGLGAASGLVPREEPGVDASGVEARVGDDRAEGSERPVQETAAPYTGSLQPPDGSSPPERTSALGEEQPPPLPPQAAPDRLAASSQIVLEPLAPDPGAVTAGITGFDTGAPRELVLWRLRAGRAHRLGSAASDSDARIHGPQLPLPAEGVLLVATPVGVRPGELGASEPLRLVRAPLETSQGEEIR